MREAAEHSQKDWDGKERSVGRAHGAAGPVFGPRRRSSCKKTGRQPGAIDTRLALQPNISQWLAAPGLTSPSGSIRGPNHRTDNP